MRGRSRQGILAALAAGTVAIGLPVALAFGHDGRGSGGGDVTGTDTRAESHMCCSFRSTVCTSRTLPGTSRTIRTPSLPSSPPVALSSPTTTRRTVGLRSGRHRADDRRRSARDRRVLRRRVQPRRGRGGRRLHAGAAGERRDVIYDSPDDTLNAVPDLLNNGSGNTFRPSTRAARSTTTVWTRNRQRS